MVFKEIGRLAEPGLDLDCNATLSRDAKPRRYKFTDLEDQQVHWLRLHKRDVR